jgi:hypothetical protein
VFLIECQPTFQRYELLPSSDRWGETMSQELRPPKGLLSIPQMIHYNMEKRWDDTGREQLAPVPLCP